jgi:hypothetical protein
MKGKKTGRRKKGTLGATVSVELGYELHSITLTAINWSRVKSGRPLRIRGKGFYYEGEFFWDYWNFGGGLDGELLVEYGEGGASGFIGKLEDAIIEEQSHRNERQKDRRAQAWRRADSHA